MRGGPWVARSTFLEAVLQIYLRGGAEQRLRLLSGLILFAFATSHFLNHALGLVSLEVMHDMQQLRTAITRSVAGTFIMSAALVTHIALSLTKMARRNTWRMPVWEGAQIALGLAIPFFLLPHIVNTRIAHQFFGVEDSYLYELVRLWPESALVQLLLLVTVWAHGCLGLHYWLRLSEPYRSIAPVFLAIAIAVPVLAFAGFAVAGRTVSDIMSDPEALAALKSRSNWPGVEDGAALAWLRATARMAFYALLIGVIGVAIVLHLSRRALGRRVRVHFSGASTVVTPPGKTLLELSRAAGLAHASVCGGRGRCSTCRVRVDDGLDRLPPAVGAEAVTLTSIGAPSNVRLACQIRPATDLTVTLISRPAVSGPPQEIFSDLKEVVGAHVRGAVGPHLVDLASSDTTAVEQWLKENGQEIVRLPDTTTSEFALQGARIEYIDRLPTVTVVYRKGGRLISLFQSPLGDASSLAMRGQWNGYHVRTLSFGRSFYAIVSDLPATELDLMEATLKPPEPELRLDIQAAIQ